VAETRGGSRRGLLVAVSLAFLASLAVAAAGAVLALSEAQRGMAAKPEPVSVEVAGFVSARVNVTPLLILGNRSVLLLSRSNSSLVAPFLAIRAVEAAPRLVQLTAVEGARAEQGGEAILRVWLVVHGFRVPLGSHRGHVVLNVTDLVRLAEAASLEAGLKRPSNVRIVVEARLPVSVAYNGTVKRLLLKPSLVVEKRGSLVEFSSIGDSGSAVFEPAAPAPGEERPRLGIYMLMVGAAGMVASAVVYAYSRPRPIVPPERRVEGSLPPGLPVVEVAAAKTVAEMAEKLDTIVIDDGARLCVVDRGVAYCAPKPGAAHEAEGGAGG